MNLDKLVEMLDKALKDEKEAELFYTEVLKATNDYLVREAFVEARHDEREHIVKISDLYRDLTGKSPVITGVLPEKVTNIKEAVQKAIKGEEAAIRDYLEIINYSTLEKVDRVIYEIRNDEIVHLEKFQALYHTL
ncbi:MULTISPECIES: ferritin family protein [Carboxydothermus]|uniref:Rubrerythrin diiron-binding domain-containing protein n=2 Tax=Carboxydothermus TaxID=129957 RepID=Q3A8Y7_CARHZ|nr:MULTISPECIES: ferritin-like domain-containing protein [Carboxydothermus]ABB13639.1 conserved hypothetical protein [Carboxydothermus hydrogenoformans Z-2901]NYE57660.1 rubrerythrin [Carboxydothermus ferrireducens DSM 11255]